MKRLSSTDIGYEKNLSGPNVMSWTLAGTKTTVLEFGWIKNISPGIWLDNKTCPGITLATVIMTCFQFPSKLRTCSAIG